MKKLLNKNTFILLFLTISIIAFFLPWFYFEESVDYRTGIYWLKNPVLILCYFCSIVFALLKVNAASIISNTLILIYEIYIFFTWHIMNITGEVDIGLSISTAHYGFYISFISILIATVINLITIKRHSNKIASLAHIYFHKIYVRYLITM